MELSTLEETYGKLLLSELFTSVWFGHWDDYEAVIGRLPEELVAELPFHEHYNREDTALWRDNYFQVPGDYFIPPYLSSYFGKGEEEQEQAKQDVLCLIGEFDKLGFYYPLEQGEFPDHFGSVTAFLTAAVKEEIKALEANDETLAEKLLTMQHNVYDTYMKQGIEKMLAHGETKWADPFFKEFLPFYGENMKDIHG
ncbi:molecular chaperone TorD family protein [Lentibacillus saliphilus]|uniref:molecular chaperone TorD family protein n=1 Tax=Lentibacillus saliphilus TaxID=2737028 RepID=UPI001C3088F5|nr:molecular chaperone TorD family protein [Lentibacillus saliphilus]